MTFLQVITRTYKRPNMLINNIASLKRQTDGDYLQTFLNDEMGRGIDWASKNMAEYAPHLIGEYIWILDDDDECIYDRLIAELKKIVAVHQPDIIMLKMDHGPLGIKPEPDYWQKPPVEGHIGISAYVVKRDLWQQHAQAFKSGRYQADYDFIRSAFESGKVYWHDVVASRVQRISYGTPE